MSESLSAADTGTRMELGPRFSKELTLSDINRSIFKKLWADLADCHSTITALEAEVSYLKNASLTRSKHHDWFQVADLSTGSAAGVDREGGCPARLPSAQHGVSASCDVHMEVLQ